MAEKLMSKFFFSIVVPSVLAIILFIISFYKIIIPMFEKNMMDRKKEMILELTNTAWSVLDEFNTEFKNGEITLDEAQKNAALQIEKMRYGKERKDYFWVITIEPTMVVHPYRKELYNTNLANYFDSHDNNLFVDAVSIVKKQKEGFIEYYWQWKDDTTKIVPKLSYVKGFDEWQWILGTGVYLEDVQQELANLKNRLLTISAIIISIIILTLIYVIRQSLNIENKRRTAEQHLRSSRQKYKSLVDASTEGTLMFVNRKVVFANMKFYEMFDSESKSVIGLSFGEVFEMNWSELIVKFTNPNKSVTTETHLLRNNNLKKEIVISVSRINYSQQEGFIVIVKDVSKQIQIEKGTHKLTQELQTSLQLMNQPIKAFVKEIIVCNMNATIEEAAKLMTLKNQKIIFIKSGEKIIGTVNHADLNKRVLAESLSPKQNVMEVMSAPIVAISINALLYEAVLVFKKKWVSHLLVKNFEGDTIGCISNQDCLEMQRNSLSYLIQEIEISQHINELKLIYSRMPVMINALFTSGDNINNISRVITSVADAITARVINMAIENIGKPPCEFVFIAMGSEGRCEQTLKTDQDNAIIFDDSDKNNQPYFLNLARLVNKNLDTIGYNNCQGQIMANNTKWCQPYLVWKKYFTQWTSTPDAQSILDSSIFFDFRHIYGNIELVNKLKEHVCNVSEQNNLFFHHLSASIVNYKPSIEKHSVNLKKVLLPIIGYTRIYALNNEIIESNTLERLSALFRKGIINKSRKDEIEKMYSFLMHIRIKNQINQILNNELPENTIQIQLISRIEENTIKNILSELSVLQEELRVEFKGFE